MQVFSARLSHRRRLISLTPLIDVVFILLVFFMLASSFLDWRALELTAPPESMADSGPGLEGALMIEIHPGGLRFAGETLAQGKVLERVAARLNEFPQTTVLVRPAPGVTLQHTVTLLDRLVELGASDVALIRSPGP